MEHLYSIECGQLPVAEAEGVLRSFPFKPFGYYREVHPDALVAYFRDCLSPRDGREWVVGRTPSRVVAAVAMDQVPWDSRIFSLPMARIPYLIVDPEAFHPKSLGAMLDRLLERAGRAGYSFLDTKIDTRAIEVLHLLEDRGFRVMDVLTAHVVDLRQSGAAWQTASDAVRVRPFEARDTGQLVALSEQAYGDRAFIRSRFHMDGRLPRDRADALYGEWFGNCIAGTAADQILVADHDGEAVGYITCKIHAEEGMRLGIRFGSVPLNAVAADVRGQGIYRTLAVAALQWFRGHGCDFAEIRTQVSTIRVQAIWESIGGRLAASWFSLHRWVEGE